MKEMLMSGLMILGGIYLKYAENGGVKINKHLWLICIVLGTIGLIFQFARYLYKL